MFDAISEYVMLHRLYTEFPIGQIFNNMLFVAIRGISTQKGIDAIDAVLNASPSDR